MRTTLQQRAAKFETWAMIAAPFFAILLAVAAWQFTFDDIAYAYHDVLEFLGITHKWKLEYVADIQAPIPEDYVDRMPWVGGYMTMDDDTAKVRLAIAGYKGADFTKWGYVLVHGPKIIETDSRPGRMWIPFADWKEVEKYPQWHIYRHPRRFYRGMAHNIPYDLSLMYPERAPGK